MNSRKRRFNLRIWGLVLGYFAFYIPYSALIKIYTSGLLPDADLVSGFRLLPATLIGTVLMMVAIITALGWWKYARCRVVFGFRVPCPSAMMLLAGLGMALIIGTTTLAYTFQGISILFALLLLRGGVLILAPMIDFAFRRRVRWFSWAAFALSIAALMVALSDVNSDRMTLLAVIDIAAYLTGYLLRLPCMNALAKTTDDETTRRYFVEEQLIALPLLLAIPACFALIGYGEQMSELRQGFMAFLDPSSVSSVAPYLLIGVLYACLCLFGTLIYLDRRENTFCVPLNRASSLLSGVVAAYVLSSLFQLAPPSTSQFVGVALIALALLFLSPLHHFELYPARVSSLTTAVLSLFKKAVAPLSQWARGTTRTGQASITQARREHATGTDLQRHAAPVANLGQRVFLFVCSGNTCRSPMAEAIGHAEIIARLHVPSEALDEAPVRALSAGVSARSGAPMTPEAQEALRLLGVPVFPHQARNLSIELVHRVEKIFCMTQAHRTAVIQMIPAAAIKTQCLDDAGDIEDPIGHSLETYLKCARRIQSLVRGRLDEAGLTPTPVVNPQ